MSNDPRPWWDPERHRDRRPFLLERARIESYQYRQYREGFPWLGLAALGLLLRPGFARRRFALERLRGLLSKGTSS